MSKDVAADGREEPQLDGRGLRVSIVCGRFNDHITVRLLDGVRRGLEACHVTDVVEEWVPGAFEIPLMARAHALAGADAVIGIGCVIRGDTAHFDFVAGECARGIQQVALETGVPIVFGVLTTETLEQALARSEEAGGHNVGEEGARVAVEMATKLAALATPERLVTRAEGRHPQGVAREGDARALRSR